MMEFLACAAPLASTIAMAIFYHLHKQMQSGAFLFLFIATSTLGLASIAFAIVDLTGQTSIYASAVADMGIMVGGISLAVASGWLGHIFSMAGEHVD